MFWTSIKFFLTMTVLTGGIYPLLVTGIAQFSLPKEANGSFIFVDGKNRGSELIAQAFKDERYFWPRPSAIAYNPLHSGGSNLGPTSSKLKEIVHQRAQELLKLPHPTDKTLPTELLYASSSGLDPHISVDAAIYQFDRIAKARSLTSENRAEYRESAKKMVEGAQGGFLGSRYVNVLKLNQLLDQQFPLAKAP